MGFVIRGRARCRICNELHLPGEALVSVPPCIGNRLDPLYLFNDAAFHVGCFVGHPQAKAVQEIERRLRENWEIRICCICGERLAKPNEEFRTEYLADQGPLSEFNFLQIHQSCLGRWSEKDRFQQAFANAVADGRFENEYTVRYFESVLGSP